MVALTQADGISILHETVYENRLGFASALGDMGARIQVYRECLGGSSCHFGRSNYNHSAVVLPGPMRCTARTSPSRTCAEASPI